MASITGGKPAAEVTDRVNAVLSVTEAKLYAVSLTDDHGRKGVATVMVFGKTKGDKPGVFLLLDNDQMQRELRIATPHIAEAVAKHISASTPADEGVPAHIMHGLSFGDPEPAPTKRRGRGKKTTPGTEE